MYVSDHKTFLEAQFADRLDALLEGVDVGNGTPVAAALADAFRLDVRMSGKGIVATRALSVLTDEQIENYAFDLIDAIAIPHRGFELPSGTKVESRGVADFVIGGEHWILDAGRPGLHPMEAMRRDAHGPNLDLLHLHIERLTKRLACRRLGLPSAHLVVETHDRHLLQFPPFEPAAGVTLQRIANDTDAPRFCAALPGQIEAFAVSIVDDMRVLFKRQKEIGTRAAAVRGFAESVATAENGRVLLVALDLKYQRTDETFSMYVEYHGIDEALRPGTVLDFFPGDDRLDTAWRSSPAGLTYLRDEVRALQALDADGWIDDMASAAAAAAPQGRTAVLDGLAREYETTFELPTSGVPMFATLFWSNGTIKAEISARGRLEWLQDTLELREEARPTDVVGRLEGMAIDRVTQLPFDCGLEIERVEEMHDGARLRVRCGRRLVNLSTGRIWDAPAGMG